MLIDVTESGDHFTVKVHRPSTRYFDDFLSLNCKELLLRLAVLPNAKEITESLGAYKAAKQLLPSVIELGNPNRAAVIVADGSTPRTGAVFALRTRWAVASIDPQLVDKPIYRAVDRLTIYPCRVEDVHLRYEVPVIIVAVHSHASLRAAVEAVTAPSRAVVAMGCCVPQDLDLAPDAEYPDWGIWSPKRIIKLWKSV